MHVLHLQSLFLLLSALLAPALANVEKAIFVAQSSSHSAALDVPGNDDSAELALSHNDRAALKSYQGAFPQGEGALGREYGVRLEGLNPGQRYELRVCWAATSPSDFHVRYNTPSTVLNTNEKHSDVSIHVSSAYFTSSRRLMLTPAHVNTHVILDPYLFNVLPASLLPVVVYIPLVVLVAHVVSGKIIGLLGSRVEGLQRLDMAAGRKKVL